MELTLKEKIGWCAAGAGILISTAGTYGASGLYPAMIYFGGSLVLCAAGLGIAGLRPAQGGR